MPFDVFGIIEEKLEEARFQLETRRFNDPESVSEEEIKNLTRLFTAFRAAKKATDSLAESDEPITEDQATEALSAYVEYMEQAKAYSELPEGSIPKEMLPAMDDLQNMMLVVEAHAKGLENVAKAGEGADPVTMKDIQSDFSWVADIFNVDPNAADKDEVPEEKWVAADHSMQENVEKYRESIKPLLGTFCRHWSVVSGSKDPIKGINAKIDLMQMAAEKAQLKGDRLLLEPIKSLIAAMVKGLEYKDISKLERTEIINSAWFELMPGITCDPAAPIEDIKLGYIRFKNEDAFITALKKLDMRAFKLGVDNKTLQVLDESSLAVAILGGFTESVISYNGDVDPTLNGDTDDPMFTVIEKGKKLTDSVIRFIQGDPAAVFPTKDDIIDLMEALADGCIRSPLFVRASGRLVYNQNKLRLKDACKSLDTYFPGMEDRFMPLIEECEAHTLEECKAVIREYIQTPYLTDEFDVLSTKITEIKACAPLSDEEKDRLDFLVNCRERKTRESNQKNSLDTKSILFSYIADYEIRCVREYYKHDPTIEGKVNYPHNPDVARICNDRASLTIEDVEKLNAYIDSVMNRDVVKDLLKEQPADLRRFLDTADMGALLYGPGPRVPKSLSGYVLKFLTEDAESFWSKNSQQYKDVYKAIETLSEDINTVGGISADSYKGLYDACITYLYTHDSKPLTPTGKVRVKGCAHVAAEIYHKVYESFPDMREKMERDLEINMIRSSYFRRRVREYNPDLVEAADEVETVLHDMLDKTMITGKAETPEVQNALLGKFRTLAQRHGEEMEKRKPADGEMKPEKGGGFHLS